MPSQRKSKSQRKRISDSSSKKDEHGDTHVLLGVMKVAATLGDGVDLEFDVLFHFELDDSLVSLIRARTGSDKNPIEALGVSAVTTLMTAMQNALLAGSTIGVMTRFNPTRYARAALLDFAHTRVGREPISDATVANTKLLSLAPVDVVTDEVEFPVVDGWIVVDGEFAHLEYRHFIPANDPEHVFHQSTDGGTIK